MSTTVSLSIEIELPEADEAYLDTAADDLAYEGNLNRLRSKIAQWARLISGLPCHVEITVD